MTQKQSRHGQEKIETCSSTRKKSVHVAKETQKLSENTQTVKTPLTFTSPQWPLVNYNNDNNNNNNNNNDNDNNIYRGSPTLQGGFQWGPRALI